MKMYRRRRGCRGESAARISRVLTNAATTLLLAASAAAQSDGLLTRVEAFSGHIAVLPAPGLGDLDSTRVGRTLLDAGLAPRLTVLAPSQLADTNFFTARRFPVALHLGFESYLQTVRRAGDGDRALRSYLSGGGTLLVLPSGPFPLFYNEKGQPANGSAVIGLNIGAGSFESPPPGLKLAFRANTNQSVLSWPASQFEYPPSFEADQRWRPSRAPGGPDVRYTPLATLLDDKGGNHGEGAALLEFTQGPLRGGRVLYVWFSLLANTEERGRIVIGALHWALADRAAPTTTHLRDNFEGRQEVLGDGALWLLQGGTWRIESGTLLGENCVADGYEIRGAARGNVAWRDYALSVRFKVESRGSDWRDGPWFGLRCRADGDGYYLTFTDRDCQLHKVIYGLSTTDANPLVRVAWKPDNAWHTLHLEGRANQIQATLDGKLLFEVKDDAHLNHPSLRSGGVVLAARKGSASQGNTVVRFDDVEVRLLEVRESPGNSHRAGKG